MVAVLLCSFTSLPEKSWWQAAEFAPPLETAVLAARPLLPNDLSSRVRFPLR
jgi:membrane protein required for colicin V production